MTIFICISLRKLKLRRNNTNHNLCLSSAGGRDRVKYSLQEQLARRKGFLRASAQLREEMNLPAGKDRSPPSGRRSYTVSSRRTPTQPGKLQADLKLLSGQTTGRDTGVRHPVKVS